MFELGLVDGSAVNKTMLSSLDWALRECPENLRNDLRRTYPSVCDTSAMSRKSEGKWQESLSGDRETATMYSPIFLQDRLICPWKAQGSLEPDGVSPSVNVSPIRHDHDEVSERWHVSS